MELNKALRPKTSNEVLDGLKKIKDPFNKLIYSCFYGYIEILKEDLEEEYIKSHPNEAAANAACGNNVKILKYLKSIGINIHDNGNNSLKWACLYSSYEAVKFLLEDCNSVKYEDLEDAHRMAQRRDDQAICSLLEYNVNKKYERSVEYENK